MSLGQRGFEAFDCKVQFNAAIQLCLACGLGAKGSNLVRQTVMLHKRFAPG
jgi:hypothetical protein